VSRRGNCPEPLVPESAAAPFAVAVLASIDARERRLDFPKLFCQRVVETLPAGLARAAQQGGAPEQARTSFNVELRHAGAPLQPR